MTKRGSFFSNSFDLLKQTFSEWLEDKAPQLGAALAYYTVFSLAPLILVLLAIVGFIFQNDPAGAWRKITEQMSYFLDKSAVDVVQNIAQKASQPGKGLLASPIGVLLALFGASGVFAAVTGCAEHDLGRKGKAGRWYLGIPSVTLPLFRDGGRCLFPALGLPHIGKCAQRLQPLCAGNARWDRDRPGGLLDF